MKLVILQMEQGRLECREKRKESELADDQHMGNSIPWSAASNKNDFESSASISPKSCTPHEYINNYSVYSPFNYILSHLYIYHPGELDIMYRRNGWN